MAIQTMTERPKRPALSLRRTSRKKRKPRTDQATKRKKLSGAMVLSEKTLETSGSAAKQIMTAAPAIPVRFSSASPCTSACFHAQAETMA